MKGLWKILYKQPTVQIQISEQRKRRVGLVVDNIAKQCRKSRIFQFIQDWRKVHGDVTKRYEYNNNSGICKSFAVIMCDLDMGVGVLNELQFIE